MAVIDAAIPKKIPGKGRLAHPPAGSSQALRIAVNDELDPLADRRSASAGGYVRTLAGRLCVITFHSLEDRIVKNTFRELGQSLRLCPRRRCRYASAAKTPTVKLITRKPITASAEELAEDPRSRGCRSAGC